MKLFLSATMFLLAAASFLDPIWVYLLAHPELFVLYGLPVLGAIANAFQKKIAERWPNLAAFLRAIFPVVQKAVMAAVQARKDQVVRKMMKAPSSPPPPVDPPAAVI